MAWEGEAKGTKPPKFEAYVAHCQRQVAPVMKSLTSNLGNELVRHVKENTPVDVQGDHPGRLRNSVKKRAMTIFDEYGEKIYETGAYTEVDYGPYVESGTGLWGPKHAKYKIEPKTPGGMLHWVDRHTGKDVYAKWVMHPGSPGQHMFMIGVLATESEFERLAEEAMGDFRRRCEEYTDKGQFGKIKIPKAA